MAEPVRRKDNDRDDGGAGQGIESPPDLDRAGGISRDDLNPDRFGGKPVEQDDRSRDRQLEEPLPS